MTSLRETRSIQEYKDTLFMRQYVMDKKAGLPAGEFPDFLRGFRWYRHENRFEDVYNAALVAMPVLGGYVVAKAAKEKLALTDYPLSKVNRGMQILAAYLDGSPIEVAESEDPADLVSTPCYSIESDLAELPDVLTVDVAREKDAELRAEGGAEWKESLDKNAAERIALLKERFSDITACKNCVYNIVREIGKNILPAIEEALSSLLPADQDFLLHGLDAFPKNKEVLAFYDRFLESTPPEYLKIQVEKYRGRVKKGVKTTGWES